MAHTETRIVTGSEIEAVFGMRDAVECVEDAFRAYGEGSVQMPPKVYLAFEKGDMRCMPVYMPTLGVAGVKNVTVHPQNRDLPAVMAIISLIEPETGFPLAIMDGTYITSLRTGAAGAVAARHLAREDSCTVAFIGAGRQAQTQLEGLLVVRPNVRRVLVYDLNAAKAQEFCRWCGELGAPEAEVAPSVEAAASEADILVTTTPARKPVVQSAWVKDGTHINAIGADAQGKQELDPTILKRGRVIIDNWEQASHSGEINVPVAKGILKREDVVGDIGQVVTGRVQGRQSERDITVFDSTGLAVQDIACAAEVWHRLTRRDARRGGRHAVSFF
jgi:alanine dehydrogenase